MKVQELKTGTVLAKLSARCLPVNACGSETARYFL